jgi:hypothetical protein
VQRAGGRTQGAAAPRAPAGEPLPAELEAAAALAHKAGAARVKGRVHSSCEHCAAALAAARPHCPPDSLITAQLLLAAHVMQHIAATERGEEAGLAFRGCGQLEEAVAILARRHAAGTLIPCLPVEQRFYERSDAAQVPLSPVLGAFGGYLDYICACTFLVKRLIRAATATCDARGVVVPPPQALQLRADVQAAYERFTLSGLELMRDAHVHAAWPVTLWSNEELTLIRGLHDSSRTLAGCVVPGTWADALLRAFAAGRFAARAGFTAGGACSHGQLSAVQDAALAASRAADLAKHGVQRCGLASCGAAEAHPRQFKRCGACCHASASYCCKEHQAAAWQEGHKKACKALRPQPAAPAADA